MIKIDISAQEPIYLQIANAIVDNIENGNISQGFKLPSINDLCKQLQVARGTVTKAYDYLEEQAIISSQHGKGYFIQNTELNKKLNIFLLLDEIPVYKQVFFSHFKDTLGENVNIQVFFYHHNLELFTKLIDENNGKFNHYVIMPHFDIDTGEVIKRLPPSKVLIINQNVFSLGIDYPAVYQDFEKDVYNGLKTGWHLLKKYESITLIKSKTNFQYVPAGIILGFKKFCIEYGFAYSIIDDLDIAQLKSNHAYLVFSERDLIEIVKFSRKNGFELGKNLGLIGYDDTPVREVLENGITVISTDFAELGKTAATMLLEKSKIQKSNPGGIIVRGSL